MRDCLGRVVGSIQSLIFLDFFDFNHKLSLISLYVNERPLFFQGNHVFTPLTLDSALLRRSPARLKVFSLLDFILPTDCDVRASIIELSKSSRELINTLAATTAETLLNRPVSKDRFQVGQ